MNYYRFVWCHCVYCGKKKNRRDCVQTPKGNIVCKSCVQSYKEGNALKYCCASCKTNIENRPYFFGKSRLCLCSTCYIKKKRGKA